jgi:hypothetical protein
MTRDVIDLPISNDATASRARSVSSAHAGKGPSGAEDIAEALTAGFHAAVEAAIEAAHADGHAVSGIEDGVAVEYRPDGKKRAIDQTTDWSPTGWRHR